MIIIVDYGLGNIGSVSNLLKKIGVQSKITSDINDIALADKLILPGVGSFDEGVNNLKDSNIWNILNKKVTEEKVPILGICLGMQLLTNGSEEGKLGGFGWIDAYTYKFDFPNLNLKIPHMGWNEINKCMPHKFLYDVDSDSRYYYVHSYYVKCKNRENVLATCSYGINFDSIIYTDNIYGVQFHPEKSHKFGMKILENFSKI